MSVQAISWALEHSRAEHSARLVLISLANHAGGDDCDLAWPSVPTIARETRLGESTVRVALQALRDLGEVEELDEPSPRRTRVFRLLMNPTGSAGVQDLRGRRSGRATPQNLTADPAASAPEPLREPSEGPSSLVEHSSTTPDIRRVFDAWVTATERDARRTKLTPDRRRTIQKAIASHGLDDCLAAVRNIGADAWARGQNDRGRRFDDLEHALSKAERIERWRDRTVASRPGVGTEVARGDEALARLMGERNAA